MKRFIFFILLCISAFFNSCNNIDLIKENSDVSLDKDSFCSYELQMEEAKQLVIDFVKTNKTKSSYPLDISGYKKWNYQISNSALTKSVSSLDETIPVYEFVCRSNEKEGFALVIADKRIASVLAYTEYGSLNDTLFNMPLKYFIQTIPGYIKESLEKVTTSPNSFTRAGIEQPVEYVCSPMVSWGQTSPYNAKVPCLCANGDPKYGGKAPAGCVAVAIAQLMAYHKFPTSFNWNLLLSSPTISQDDAEERKNEVARLIADIGDKVSMDYDCSGSGSNIDAAQSALRAYGYSTYGINLFNVTLVANNIKGNKPVYIRGVDADNIGHAWLVTGWKHYVVPDPLGNNEIYDYLLMNWGWSGKSDGWYRSKTPSPSDPIGGLAIRFNQSLKIINR